MSQEQRNEALIEAAENGHGPTVRLLLEAGADVRACDALRWAAYNGHDTTARLLLEAGADVHALDDDALRLAAENGHDTTVRLLLGHGARLSAPLVDEAFIRIGEHGPSVLEALFECRRLLDADVRQHLEDRIQKSRRAELHPLREMLRLGQSAIPAEAGMSMP